MTRDIGLKGLKLLADVAVTDTDDANVDAIPSNQDNNKTPNNAVADKTPHTDTNESTTKKKNVAKKDNAKTPAAYNDKSKTSKYTKDKSTPRTSKQPVDLVLGNAENVEYEHLSQPVDTPAKEKVLAEHKTLLNFATGNNSNGGGSTLSREQLQSTTLLERRLEEIRRAERQHITVQGCGTSAVNGLYTKTGTLCEGSPTYSKTGIYNGNSEVIVIFCRKSGTNRNKHWFIGISGKPVFFYTSIRAVGGGPNAGSTDLPPLNAVGWMTKDKGIHPRPSLTKDDVDEREDGDDGSHINNGDEEDDEYEYDMDEDQVSYVCQYVLSTLTNVYNLNSFFFIRHLKTLKILWMAVQMILQEKHISSTRETVKRLYFMLVCAMIN